MRTKIRTLLSIAFPLLTSSADKPRFFGFLPEPVTVKGIRREGEDVLFVLPDPAHALIERDSVLSEAVREVDRQPVGSALSQGLTGGEFEGRPADRIRLRVHQLWYRISAAPVVHLMRIVDSRVFAELFSDGQAGDDDVPGTFTLLVLQS